MKENEQSIAPYLPLYLGCECHFNSMWVSKLVGIYPSEVEPGKIIALADGEGRQEFYIEDVRPILKRLPDMTEEDAIELYNYCLPQFTNRISPDAKVKVVMNDIKGVYYEGLTSVKDYVHWVVFLLKKGYWIFSDEYFDKGLIIDAKTIER